MRPLHAFFAAALRFLPVAFFVAVFLPADFFAEAFFPVADFTPLFFAPVFLAARLTPFFAALFFVVLVAFVAMILPYAHVEHLTRL